MVIVVVLTFIVLCVLCKQVAWSDLSYEHCGSWGQLTWLCKDNEEDKASISKIGRSTSIPGWATLHSNDKQLEHQTNIDALTKELQVSTAQKNSADQLTWIDKLKKQADSQDMKI
ncbi:hypothetical protein V8E53_004590 [Lactarius tabidus]